jgi:hypothetical protein
MGAHDQTVDKDAARNIHDDGRTLRRIEEDEWEYVGGISEMPALVPPDDARQVIVYRGQKLAPDTIYIHPDQILVTEWESAYSSAFTMNRSPFSRATFAPILDENSRVVGHVGWADGADILVPEDTVKNGRRFWSTLQKQRLAAWRQWFLDHDTWDRGPMAEARKRFQTQPTSLPVARCGYRPPQNFSTIFDEARSGPFKEEKMPQYLHDLNCFVKGGGKARVGRHFQKPGQASYLELHPGVPDGEVGSPKNPYSSGYDLLVLVDPEGYLQAVSDIRKTVVTQLEHDFKIFIGALELAMAITMIIDIIPIAVVLLRLATAVATRATIWAINLVVEEEARALLQLAAREVAEAGAKAAEKSAMEAAENLGMEAAEAALRRGAMSGPERAEAKTAWQKLKQEFWEAGNAPPKRTFTTEEAAKLNKRISDRMTELGIPKKNQGAGIRRLPPKGEEAPPGTKGMKPFMDESGKPFNPTGSTRGGNMRSGSFDPKYGGTESGISVHGNVFDDWKGFELWNKADVADRIDATIAHEWSEFNGLTHWETVQELPETKLAISPRARALTRYMRMMGEPDIALTEFTKAEWEAIKAAGKANAPFEEKLKVALELAAKGK